MQKGQKTGNCFMRDRKRYETFFNTVYIYETRKPEEKQKKIIRQEMKTIP